MFICSSMPSVVFTRCAKLTCCEVQLSLFMHMIVTMSLKGMWICHMKTPKIWTLKRENEVTATAPFLSCQIHKRTICRVLAIVYHITEAFTTVFKLFFILFSMNVIKWMKNKTYCIRNDSLIILAHKSNDFWIRRAFVLYLESWFWFYKHVRAKASVV